MNNSVRFLITFLTLFIAFYGFNIAYIGITSPGGVYAKFLDDHFNYIKVWRSLYISTAAGILELLGHTVYTTDTTLKVQGASGFRLVYSCLGYGIISCFSAFVFSLPKTRRSRLLFFLIGLLTISVLNLSRLIMISLYYNPELTMFSLNHHSIFNIILYIILLLMMFKWSNS